MMPLNFALWLRRALVAAIAFGLTATPALAQYELPDSGTAAGAVAAPVSPYDSSSGYILGPQGAVPATKAAPPGQAATAVQPSATLATYAFDTPDAIKNFKLSVGDQFTVNIWGSDLRLSQVYTIPFEGRIYLPQVGDIPVVGLTTRQVKAKIAQVLATRHPGLHVSVLLIGPRPIAVFVTGLVKHPGIVTLPALSRVSAAMDGLLPEGSMRHVVIRRVGRSKPIVVDLTKFLLFGDVAADPLLKSGDVINIGPITHRATIEGDVFSPGTYEFLPGETVKDLITLAHGAEPNAALSQASVVNDKTTIRADRVAKRLDLTQTAALDRPLADDDVYNIPTDTMATVGLPRTRVTVVGAVAHPGTYTLTIGTRLRDALNMVGGVQPGAGLREVRIYHKAPAGGAKFTHPIIEDAYKLLYERDESQDLQLHDGDLVLVPASKDLASDSAVYVYGQVGHPGKEVYRAGYRLSDYLNAAGGTLQQANLHRVTITRGSTDQTITVDAWDIMRRGDFRKDPVLQPGDVVNVPEDFFYIANFSDLAGIITTVGTLISTGLAVWTVARTFK